ncbi:MAG TPA: hypothetical protein VLF88_03945 [Candidatus Babeliales bacterium]|nr:hypothetical protein [Candidatus Babeliales bacterium]
MTEQLETRPTQTIEKHVGESPITLEHAPGSSAEARGSKLLAYQAWKEQLQSEKTRQDEARKAVYEAWRRDNPAPDPETQNRRAEAAKLTAQRHREVAHQDDLQTETADLHTRLGKKGLRRLLYPLRNARIITTVFDRARKGQYDARLHNHDPFDD